MGRGKLKKRKYGLVELVFIVLSLIAMLITSAFLIFLIVESFNLKDGGNLNNYFDILLKTPEYWVYYWNSVKISGYTLVGVIVVNLAGAYILYRVRFRGRKLLIGLLLLLMLLPYQVLMTPQLLVIYKLELFNHILGVVLPGVFGAFGIILLLQYMNHIPKETIEAAQIDGASEKMIFGKIVLPQIKDGVIALVVLSLIDTWNLVEQPQNILSDCRLQPLSISFANMQGGSIGSICAGSVIFLFPIIIIFLLTKESMVEGIGNLVVKNKK